jgi:hypothetical protein
MSEQTSPVSASTAWPNLLPPEAVAAWKKVHPEAPAMLLQQIVEDAKFVRRMAWARLIAAVLLFAGSLLLSAYFLSLDAAVGGTISAGAGTITIVTILLTGRPPAPKRK